jgi:C_GCAxxG_C_C family probable redox protein
MEEIMDNTEKAKATFLEGFACSQAVLITFCEKFGLDKDIALKLADGFGGGMGRLGYTCGAVTGAFMVIGLKQGRTLAADVESKQKTNAAIKEFVKRFKDRNRTIVCRELLNCDISTEENHKRAVELNLFKTVCPKFVGDAAEILDEIL